MNGGRQRLISTSVAVPALLAYLVLVGASVTDLGGGADLTAHGGTGGAAWTQAGPVIVVGRWTAPLPAGRYTVGSVFGPRDGRLHAGVDLLAAKQTPILAASDGTVARVVCDNGDCDVDGSAQTRGCGWFVEIRHAGDVTTRYCHQLRRPIVVVGQQVAAGQQIGVVGSSGHSAAPHLHFEVHTSFPAWNGNAVDPLVFLRAAGVSA